MSIEEFRAEFDVWLVWEIKSKPSQTFVEKALFMEMPGCNSPVIISEALNRGHSMWAIDRFRNDYIARLVLRLRNMSPEQIKHELEKLIPIIQLL